LSNVKGYTIPLCLYNKTGPTPEEVQFVELFNSLVEACKTYVCTKEANEQIAKFGDDQLQMSDLKKYNRDFGLCYRSNLESNISCAPLSFHPTPRSTTRLTSG
jgi:hypothetical protein